MSIHPAFIRGKTSDYFPKLVGASYVVIDSKTSQPSHSLEEACDLYDQLIASREHPFVELRRITPRPELALRWEVNDNSSEREWEIWYGGAYTPSELASLIPADQSMSESIEAHMAKVFPAWQSQGVAPANDCRDARVLLLDHWEDSL